MHPTTSDPLIELLALVENHSPLAEALYPDLPAKQATAKYHGKRKNARGRKFNDEERQRLTQVVLRQLKPIAEAYARLHASAPEPAETRNRPAGPEPQDAR